MVSLLFCTKEPWGRVRSAPCAAAHGVLLSHTSSPLSFHTVPVAGRALVLFESTLVSQCRLPAKAPGSLTLHSGPPLLFCRQPSCRSAGSRPRTQALRVYPRVAVPAWRQGTRVTDSDCRSARSRSCAFCHFTPAGHNSGRRLSEALSCPYSPRRLHFGRSMYCPVGIAGRGWLPVRCPHRHPPALAVHTGSVLLATILRVVILVPGHQEGGGWGVGWDPLLLGCPSTFSTFIMSCEKMEKKFSMFCASLPDDFGIMPGSEPRPDTLHIQ